VTVYVDDVRIPWKRGRWSHMFSDDPTHAELHQFALKIGLRREWFQDISILGHPYSWWECHYDVTDSKREEAIKLGAVAVGFRVWAERAAKYQELS
jgi:uncharacterized protein DUF4031